MNTTRRQFLQTTTVAASAVSLVPRSVLGGAGNTSPSEKLNIAGVGVGGMGRNNLKQCSAENIVALCDVDQSYAAKTFAQYPQAKVYRDFREMLDRQKDIDAVIIAKPRFDPMESDRADTGVMPQFDHKGAQSEPLEQAQGLEAMKGAGPR